MAAQQKTIEQKLTQIQSINPSTATKKTLRQVQAFLGSNDVKEFVKNNNKKTFFGRIFSVIGRADREELLERAQNVVDDIQTSLTIARLQQQENAVQSASKISRSLSVSIKNKMNRVSTKPKKALKPYAKSRNQLPAVHRI